MICVLLDPKLKKVDYWDFYVSGKKLLNYMFYRSQIPALIYMVMSQHKDGWAYA